jgi:hypothetical protein
MKMINHMKKIVAIMILIVTTVTTNSNAQGGAADRRNELYLGLKGGINYSNVYDSQGEKFEAESKVGFVGGAFLTIPIGTFFGVQPEVLFSQKGFKGTGMLLGTPYTITRTTSYIDVPVLFSVKPGPGVTLMAGPQFSYLIRQKDEVSNSINSERQIQEFENDDLRRNMLCFLGGIDFNFSNVVLGTRIGWDIQNNNGDGTSTTPRYKNTWLQATIGFGF